MQEIKQRLAAGFPDKAFAANCNRCKKSDHPEKSVPGGFIESPLKTKRADKNRANYINQNATEGGFLPELEPEFFFYERQKHEAILLLTPSDHGQYLCDSIFCRTGSFLPF